MGKWTRVEKNFYTQSKQNLNFFLPITVILTTLYYLFHYQFSLMLVYFVFSNIIREYIIYNYLFNIIEFFIRYCMRKGDKIRPVKFLITVFVQIFTIKFRWQFYLCEMPVSFVR